MRIAAMVTHIGFAALILALVHGPGASARMIQQDNQAEFDYFVFVRQWSGSFCHTDTSCPLVHRHGFHFTIHGLWPEYTGGGWPQFCKKDQPFDEAKLDDIIAQLKEEWPSFMKENDGFWEDIMVDEHTHFSTILNLHHSIDLAAALRAKNIFPHATKQYATADAALRAKNIFPHATKQYAAADVKAAICEFTGVEAKVHCDTKGELTEVWMCIGKDLKPFDCQSETPRCSTVIIPPLVDMALEDRMLDLDAGDEVPLV
eukprot:gene1148-3712_t